MKKVLEKIFHVSSVVLALIFIVTLLIAAFGGIEQEDFNNKIVQGLFIALGILFLACSVASITMLFSDNDVLKDVVVFVDKEGNTRANSSIIKKLTRQHINAEFDGAVKCTKVTLMLTEYGVRVRVNVKVSDRDIQKLSIQLKVLLDKMFKETLGISFYAIDFKMVAFKSAYKPNMDEVNAEADKQYDEKKVAEAEKAAATAEEKAKAVSGEDTAAVADAAAAENEVNQESDEAAANADTAEKAADETADKKPVLDDETDEIADEIISEDTATASEDTAVAAKDTDKAETADGDDTDAPSEK